MVILIFIAFIVACFTVDAIVRYSRKNKSRISALVSDSLNVFNENSVTIPKGIYFDKSHTWAFMEKNGFVKIGIDDFFLHITGPLSRLIMKNQGDKIQKGEAILTIVQNGKQLIINAPISGTVKSRNIQLEADPSILNLSPYNDGWFYTIEPSDWLRDTQFLFMADKYKEWLKNEFARLKDFLAINIQTRNAEFVPVMLQDGGELKDNVLEDFGPEVWEEFQIKFINTSK
ncbi:MAG: glycine cleavage system protein H [Bacteroidales bacterium]